MYVWNPQYAFSQIVETWLDGTFNKFLGHMAFHAYSEMVWGRKISIDGFLNGTKIE